MKGYIATDLDGTVVFYTDLPIRGLKTWETTNFSNSYFELNNIHLLAMEIRSPKWEEEPVSVVLNIKKS